MPSSSPGVRWIWSARMDRGLLPDASGQSLLELAVMLPVLVLLMGYAVDFGYFFIAAANIASSARNATEYSIQGYESPSQGTIPAAGPASATTSVAAEALADLTSLSLAGTVTAVQVCSKSNGMSGSVPLCTSYGSVGASYTPSADPEAPHFVLQRVDVTYTVQPPVPLSVFKISLIGQMQFHRQVSMRAMD